MLAKESMANFCAEALVILIKLLGLGLIAGFLYGVHILVLSLDIVKNSLIAGSLTGIVDVALCLMFIGFALIVYAIKLRSSAMHELKKLMRRHLFRLQ
ncbi:hypothetical protein [Iodobacter fluviatilis]|uniref:Uncharacterized protein n=1 Tax=Iodobacter fluviatilis TaxID=537 RepID=A0A7G3GEP2_9NEIS|nr:hypothetical protein [Iodobacter fluviatilis]QBC45861.1 hypothetical protein C1H71_20170 [Iodobacter fluviatilis]